MEIGEEEFSIPFFKDNGFIRLRCPVCKSYYWTQNPDSENCGDAPCQPYTFIGDPPTRVRCSLDEMRNRFIAHKLHSDNVIQRILSSYCILMISLLQLALYMLTCAFDILTFKAALKGIVDGVLFSSQGDD